MSATTTIPVTMIRVDQIVDSPFNPRKVYHEQGLAELAADIKAQGILQPLVVRSRAKNIEGDLGEFSHFELVFGHRRLRAARIAGLAEVPCIVSDMGDEEARRAQIGENLQREDVHPIEEAEGFQALMDEHEHRRHVRGGMKATLSQAAQDVLAERRRQSEGEGYTTSHDDLHKHRQLPRAASCYALYDDRWRMSPPNWPWDEWDWKPKDRRSNYVRAAALLLAEIERLDREAAA